MNEIDFKRAYNEILLQNKLPLVSVDTTMAEVVVPREFIEEDGTIVLDISANAVRNLKIVNDIVYCRASFNREVFCLSFPLASIKMMFGEEDI